LSGRLGWLMSWLGNHCSNWLEGFFMLSLSVRMDLCGMKPCLLNRRYCKWVGHTKCRQIVGARTTMNPGSGFTTFTVLHLRVPLHCRSVYHNDLPDCSFTAIFSPKMNMRCPWRAAYTNLARVEHIRFVSLRSLNSTDEIGMNALCEYRRVSFELCSLDGIRSCVGRAG